MLELKVFGADHPEEVSGALAAIAGVRYVGTLATDPAGRSIVLADIEPEAADSVVQTLKTFGIPREDLLLARIDVIGPVHAGPGGLSAGFAWEEVLGQARANAPLLARYLVLMGVAGVIAALGVIQDNSILIIGAMAVSPDLLPICAAAVGIVGRRWRLAGRALATLLVGLIFVCAVAAILTFALDQLDIIPPDFVLGEGGLGSLTITDYSTVLIALAAGVAAILSFETRASTAVGVAISVTTIPASAYLGVAVGLGQGRHQLGALIVLAVNVACMTIAGSLTLGFQQWLARRRQPPT